MFCNLCGSYTIILYRSHTLNSSRTRTGKVFLICKSCHIDYHKRHRDFQYWGKKGGDEIRRKYGRNYFRLIRIFKNIKIKKEGKR